MNDFYGDFPHGSSRWANDHDCNRAGLLPRGGLKKGKGVYIGGSPDRGADMLLNGDAPVTLVGGSGCSKTASLVMYSALYPGNILGTDQRGDIAACTAAHHRAKGKQVCCINPGGYHAQPPWNLTQDRCNPLDILHVDSPTLDGDIAMVLESLIPLSSIDNFFELRARQWGAALLKHLVVSRGSTDLGAFHDVMMSIEGNPEGFARLADEELLCSPVPEVITTTNKILDKQDDAPKEFSAVMSTFDKCFEFMNHREVRASVTNPNFSLSVLSERPSVVFLIIPPEYMGVWQSFIRLCITIPMLYKQRRPQAGTVLYMLDELATLGKFETAERLYSFGRGSGNRAFGVFQSVGQISKYYGQNGQQIFLSSSQGRLFKGIRDIETANLVSAMLGNQTIDVDDPKYQAQARWAKQQAASRAVFGGGDLVSSALEMAHWQREEQHRVKMQRPLLTPSEILNLPDDRMITFVSGVECPPILARTTPYYKRRDLKGVFQPNPYHMR